MLPYARPAPTTLMLIALLGCLLSTPLARADRAIEVRELRNLQLDAQRAERERIPILVAFFASWCEWCERVEQEFLRPMLLSGEYRHQVIIRKLETDGSHDLIGLDGQSITPGRLASRYRASLVPTLIFIDHQGNELAERMVGLTTPEMYGGYIDRAIEQSIERYRKPHGQRQYVPE